MLHHQGRWQEDYRNSIRKKVQGPAETQSTLPRTKSKRPWKWMVGRWIFLLWRPIFRGYVTLVRVHCLPLYSWTLGSSQKTGLQWIMKAKSRSLSKNSEWYAYCPTVVKVSLMRVPLKLVNYTIIFCPSRWYFQTYSKPPPHPGKRTWNLKITCFEMEHHLPNLHFWVPC